MNIVRYARLRAGLSQEQLAARVGIAQSSLARVESGRIRSRVDTLEKLLVACGMSLEVAPRAGVGVDRTAIRRLLKLTPARRLELATQEANNLALLRRSR